MTALMPPDSTWSVRESLSAAWHPGSSNTATATHANPRRELMATPWLRGQAEGPALLGEELGVVRDVVGDQRQQPLDGADLLAAVVPVDAGAGQHAVRLG